MVILTFLPCLLIGCVCSKLLNGLDQDLVLGSWLVTVVVSQGRIFIYFANPTGTGLEKLGEKNGFAVDQSPEKNIHLSHQHCLYWTPIIVPYTVCSTAFI